MAGEKRKQTTIDMTRTTADTTMSRPFRTFWNVYIDWTCECRAIFLHTYIWITQRKRYTYKQHNENKSQSQCQLLCAAHATVDSLAHTTYKSGQTRLTAIYWCLFCTFSPHKMRCVACENHNVYGKRIDCMRLFRWLMILLSFATHTHRLDPVACKDIESTWKTVILIFYHCQMIQALRFLPFMMVTVEPILGNTLQNISTNSSQSGPNIKPEMLHRLWKR